MITQPHAPGDYHDAVWESSEDSTPGRQAMCAIVREAISNLIEYRYLDGIHLPASQTSRDELRARQLAYITAALWVASRREDYPTAFQSIADNLNLPADKIRRKFGLDGEISFFGWKNLPVREYHPLDTPN